LIIVASQESVAGTHSGQQGNQSSTSGGGNASSVPDVGEAARKVVSGLYSLSQVVSWQVVSPIISAAVQHGQGQKTKPEVVTSERSDDEKSEEVVGGAVLVMDLGHAQAQEDMRGVAEGDNVDVAVRAHFAAHATTLGSMAFSPTGLKLASADCLGQVVLVHSLAPSGLLSRAHPVISPAGFHYCGDDETSAPPQLLFKLVRGLSLSSIIDIGFSADESVVFGSTVNGTVHVFDLDQLSALDSGSRGNSHGSSLASHSSFKSGSSLTNGGYGSLEHTSLLLSPPTTSAQASGPLAGSLGSHTNSSLLTMTAGAVTESAFQQYGIPSADVSQFLSLHRPDLRVLQGYSDIRVKLPLSETFYQYQQQEQQHLTQNGNIENIELSDVGPLGENPSSDNVPDHGADHGSGSSYYPQEVNLRSNSVLYANPGASGSGGGGGQGLESDGSYELLVGTSEGLLSRYRLTLNKFSSAQQAGGGGVTSVLSNLMPSHSQTTKELNRWDLCASLASNGKGQSSEPSYHQAFSKHNINNNSNGEMQHGSSNYSAWLYAASDIDEPLATPLWIRPQVKLFAVEGFATEVHKDISDSSNRSVHDDKGANGDTHHLDEWLEDKADNGESTSNATSKKKKKKAKQQQQHQSSNHDNDEVNVSNSHLKEDTSTISSSTSSINGGGVSKNTLFFPERQTSKHLHISRPSTFVYGSSAMQHGVGTGNTPKLDTGVILEEYIQTALGGSFSDTRRGSTPIAISMIKHSRPPEDISAWHMDDDWGNDDDEDAGNGFGNEQGIDIRTQSDC